eukprot:647109-Hanusia_phi.AAC.4
MQLFVDGAENFLTWYAFCLSLRSTLPVFNGFLLPEAPALVRERVYPFIVFISEPFLRGWRCAHREEREEEEAGRRRGGGEGGKGRGVGAARGGREGGRGGREGPDLFLWQECLSLCLEWVRLVCVSSVLRRVSLQVVHDQSLSWPVNHLVLSLFISSPSSQLFRRVFLIAVTDVIGAQPPTKKKTPRTLLDNNPLLRKLTLGFGSEQVVHDGQIWRLKR